MKSLKTAAAAAAFVFAVQSGSTLADPAKPNLPPNLPYDKFGQTAAEKKILKESWAAACEFSGLCRTPSIRNAYKDVSAYVVNSMMFIELNCSDNPSACMKMASVYNSDYPAIFIQDEVRPEKNVFNQSVLVHELVHIQQEKFSGGFANVSSSCVNLINAEFQAYSVQNKFLKSKGIKEPEEGRKFLASFQCQDHTTPKLFVATNMYR